MKIAQMENFEAFECFWDTRRNYIMSPQFDLCGVPQPASVKTRQLEAEVNSNMGKTQILNVKIVYALSKNLGFVIGFDPEAQSRV